jgi:hypothetical protein
MTHGRHHRGSIALSLAAVLAACGGGTADSAATANAVGNTAASAEAPAANQAKAAPGARASQLSRADQAAIMGVLGYHWRNGQWDASDEPDTDPNDGMDTSCPAAIEPRLRDGPSIRDLNGDGRPEVIVTSSGLFCYGMAGVAFDIVTPTANGWRRVFGETGIPIFRPRPGAAWPDIIVGGPGTCFPRDRWNGHEYVLAGGDDGEGHPCTIPGAENEPAPPPPVEPDAASGGFPVAEGFYAWGASCAAAAADPEPTLVYVTRRAWNEVDGGARIRRVTPLGGGGWRLDMASGPALTIQVSGPRSFSENGREMRYCPASGIPADVRRMIAGSD